MYWYVLIQGLRFTRPGYAALRLDSLLQFCPANSAVLETSASNDSNASSSMFQSTLGPADPLIGGAGIWGDTAEASAAAFAAGASGGAGSAEGARRWRKGT
jgi:hypothetical protein